MSCRDYLTRLRSEQGTESDHPRPDEMSTAGQKSVKMKEEDEHSWTKVCQNEGGGGCYSLFPAFTSQAGI